MAEIIWAPKAVADLNALIEFISRNAPMTALRFAQRLIARVELLENQPLMGALVPEDDSRTYREILQGNYRVIYRVSNKQVIIVAVHHAPRLLDTGTFE